MVKRANILRNSFWYGVEMGADLILGLITSVAIARVVGPEQLGHFVYLVFLTNVAGKLGGFGTAAAARKYIAEYLASNQYGLVRAIFFRSLYIQVVLAIAVPLLAMVAVAALGDPEYRLVAYLLIAAVIPTFVGAVPALANVAAESFSRNVTGALVGLGSYTAMVALSLIFGWGLLGLATAVLVRRFLEMAVRLVPAIQWMRSLPEIDTPPLLTRKLFAFSGQAFVVILLTLVVWDRCELIFLKQFADVKQLAFYSVAFSLTEYILMLPRVIGGATGAALMSAYSRNEAGPLAAAAIRRLAIVTVPVHFGVAAVSPAVVPLIYGSAYTSAIPVLAIAAFLSLPKGLYWLPQAVLQAADEQVTTMRWLALAALLNLALDVVLIPPFGAIGATIGNGVAQSFGVIILTICAARSCGMLMPWREVLRVTLCGLAMLPPAFALTIVLPPIVAAPAAVIVGALIYIGGLRLTRAVSAEDAEAFQSLGRRLPSPLRGIVDRLIATVTPAAPANSVETPCLKATVP